MHCSVRERTPCSQIGSEIFFSQVFHDPQFSLTIRKYYCKVCGLAVLGKDNIVKHATEKHEGKGAYQCQFCKKVISEAISINMKTFYSSPQFFLRLNYLDMHRTYGCAANPGRARPLCQLCGKKFCQPQKLKLHMKRAHSDDNEALLNELRCKVCEKILGTKNALQRHRREVHAEENGSKESGEKSVPQPDASARVGCDKCGRTFKNKSNLKIHMLTHSGVKPFACKVGGCKAGFTTKQCLQFHYRKSHALDDDRMPKIEREIPYTLSAYSGGRLTDRRIDLRREEKAIEDVNSDDVYKFVDDEENNEGSNSSEAIEEESHQQEEKQMSSDAGMLVMAALTAAEQV